MRIADGRLDDDKTRSKQPVITEPHTDRLSDGSRMVGGACRSEDHNVSPRKKNCPHHKIVALLSVERESDDCEYFLEYFPFLFRGTLEREVDEEIRPASIFVGGLGGDTEVLEDFSPLSTNATYWETCQDTLKGQRHRAR